MIDRILPELRFSHSIVPAALGVIACSSTAVDCTVVHDDSSRIQADRCLGHRGYRWLLLVLVCVDGCHLVYYGGHECHVAQSAVALGRGDEQTFYW